MSSGESHHFGIQPDAFTCICFGLPRVFPCREFSIAKVNGAEPEPPHRR